MRLEFAIEMRELYAFLWPPTGVIAPRKQNYYEEEMQGRSDEAKKYGMLKKSSQYAREEMKKLQSLIDACTTVDQLESFSLAYREHLEACPFPEIRSYYDTRKEELRAL